MARRPTRPTRPGRPSRPARPSRPKRPPREAAADAAETAAGPEGGRRAPTLVEDTANATRNLPIDDRLRRILLAAAERSGVHHVRVFSGGQPAFPGQPRVGSRRHDNGRAADVQIFVDDAIQDFTKAAGRRVVAAFLRNCAALGCTGIGAGPGYMGGKTNMHVGFGLPAVWGKGGRSANAPAWLVEAVQAGWDDPVDLDSVAPPAPAGGAGQPHVVIARGGLHLRGGPGQGFDSLDLLPEGTELSVLRVDGDWAMVDRLFDGAADGFVHTAFIRPA